MRDMGGENYARARPATENSTNAMYPLTVASAPLLLALPVAVLHRHSRSIAVLAGSHIRDRVSRSNIHNDGRQQGLGKREISTASSMQSIITGRTHVRESPGEQNLNA